MIDKIKIGLQTRFVIFSTAILFIIIGSILVYLNIYLNDYLRTSALTNFQIIAETGEGAYFAFAESLKIRAIDWSSDGRIRSGVKSVLDAKSAKEKDIAARALGSYLRDEKMQYDPSVVIVDILDKDGIVIASSHYDRIGTDEAKEEHESRVHRFSEAIRAGFGSAFITSAVAEPSEHMNAMIHSVTHIFSAERNANGDLVPQDAVMLVHFDKIDELAHVLSGMQQIQQGAKTGLAFFEKYKSADIFLVNGDRNMITKSRFSVTNLKQKINTLPINDCFELDMEMKQSYVNHNGVQVYGASMCMKRDNLVLVVEVEQDEVLGEAGNLRTTIMIGEIFAIIIGILASVFFTRRFMGKLASNFIKENSNSMD